MSALGVGCLLWGWGVCLGGCLSSGCLSRGVSTQGGVCLGEGVCLPRAGGVSA